MIYELTIEWPLEDLRPVPGIALRFYVLDLNVQLFYGWPVRWVTTAALCGPQGCSLANFPLELEHFRETGNPKARLERPEIVSHDYWLWVQVFINFFSGFWLHWVFVWVWSFGFWFLGLGFCFCFGFGFGFGFD